jgi:hypothetical protein
MVCGVNGLLKYFGISTGKVDNFHFIYFDPISADRSQYNKWITMSNSYIFLINLSPQYHVHSLYTWINPEQSRLKSRLCVR